MNEKVLKFILMLLKIICWAWIIIVVVAATKVPIFDGFWFILFPIYAMVLALFLFIPVGFLLWEWQYKKNERNSKTSNEISNVEEEASENIEVITDGSIENNNNEIEEELVEKEVAEENTKVKENKSSKNKTEWLAYIDEAINVPNIPTGRSTIARIYDDEIRFGISKFFSNEVENPAFILKLKNITKIQFVKKEEIHSRVTATRIALLGAWAFAAKKKTVKDNSCLMIEYVINGVEGLILMEAKGRLQNVICKNFVDTVLNRILSSNFEEDIEDSIEDSIDFEILEKESLNTNEIYENLKKIHELKEIGILTEEEYLERKNILLDKLKF